MLPYFYGTSFGIASLACISSKNASQIYTHSYITPHHILSVFPRYEETGWSWSGGGRGETWPNLYIGIPDKKLRFWLLLYLKLGVEGGKFNGLKGKRL